MLPHWKSRHYNFCVNNLELMMIENYGFSRSHLSTISAESGDFHEPYGAVVFPNCPSNFYDVEDMQ